ncbi:MAG: sulfotransferase [Thermoguttaceae bacterium]|jgi:LPS sulfotransferase NodH
MTITAWLGALARNRFAISPSRVPMALIIAGMGLVNSCLAGLQSLIYGRRIVATEIKEDPIFVVGHWRSGTTLLHELLVCDPRHTYPDTYACFAPKHFLATQWFAVRLLSLLLAPKRPMDNMPFGWNYPQEDEWAIVNMGLPSPYLTMLFPNRPQQYPEYLDMRGVPPADLDRWKAGVSWFLKCLTLKQPKRIVLKTPLHTARIRTLLAMFPKARFVHVVRDPCVIFSSTMHTWRQLYQVEGLQVPTYAGLEQNVLDTFVRMYEAFDEDIQELPPSQLCEVRYEDLVRDMAGEVRRIYDSLGLDGFEQVVPALDAYAAKTASYKPNRYQLPPELRDQVTARWRKYAEKYDYGQPSTRSDVDPVGHVNG